MAKPKALALTNGTGRESHRRSVHTLAQPYARKVVADGNTLKAKWVAEWGTQKPCSKEQPTKVQPWALKDL